MRHYGAIQELFGEGSADNSDRRTGKRRAARFRSCRFWFWGVQETYAETQNSVYEQELRRIRARVVPTDCDEVYGFHGLSTCAATKGSLAYGRD